MARKARTPPLVRLRRFLLVLLVLFSASLVGLFLFGRAGLSERTVAPQAPTQAMDELFAVEGEGFDFTLYQEDRAVFRIRGDRTRADRQDNVFLEKVLLTFFRQDGEYLLESDRATYHQDTHASRLEGNVRLRGPEGLVVTTDWLRLEDEGNVLVASRGTRFGVGDDLVGEAETLRIDLEEETFTLGGGVIMKSSPRAEISVAMHARRVVYRKHQRLVRAAGDVRLEHGADYLAAQQINLFLAKETDRIRFVRAVGQVAGSTTGPETVDQRPQPLLFKGSSLAVLMDSETRVPVKVELEGNRGRRAALRAQGPGGIRRSLSAIQLSGNFVKGVLETAEALGPVQLLETFPQSSGGAVRKASSHRARARFDGLGDLAQLALEGGVTLDDPPFRVVGDRAQVDSLRGSAEVFGDPVEVTSEEGDLLAPQVTYLREKGLLHAKGRVRSTLNGGAGAGTWIPFKGAEGPVRVESDEVFWQRSAQEFLFRDNVRAWQGKNLLLAQQLRGDQLGEKISASGAVKTIVHPPPPESTASVEEEAPESDRGMVGRSQAPIEVRSTHMSFFRPEGKVVYNGRVRVDQDGRHLTCNEMEILLDEENTAETLICSGRAALADPQTGRTIEGERAVYHLEEGVVEFLGDPLTVRDDVGGWIQGKRLRYQVEDGAIQVDSAKEAAGAPPPEPLPSE